MMAKYIIGRQSKNRMKIIRYSVVMGIYLFLAAILQTSLLSRIKPFGGVPDIMIASVICFSIYCGCYAGAICGIAAGFVTDALGSVGFSVLPLIYFFVGYLFGYYAKVLNVRKFLAYLIGIGIALPVRLITTLVQTMISSDGFRLSTFLLSVALPEMLSTALLSLLIFFPVCGISKWLKKRD